MEEDTTDELVFNFMDLLLDFIDQVETMIITAQQLGIEPRIIIMSDIARRLIISYNSKIKTEKISFIHNIPIISSDSLQGLEFRVY